MTHRHLWILAVVAAIAVLGLSTLWQRGTGSDQPAVPTAPALGSKAAPTGPTTPAVGPAAGSAPLASAAVQVPAWRAASASGPVGPVPVDDKARVEREARLAAVKQAMDQMSAEDRQDPRKVADALLRLEQANGSPNLSGVRLDVLRQNLAIAAEMQKLTGELQALRGEIPQGKEPPAGLTERIRAKLAQIGAVQQQLRTDVMDASLAPQAAASSP
jgi:hypothetical protein